jgi:DNA mismatch endonuclease (patch repair protein)
MADVFTKRKRSLVMAAVRGAGNATTEKRIVKAFRAAGITGWRRHVPMRLRRRGTATRTIPDFVLRSRRVVIFIDGCFWHGCNKHGTQPKTNALWWRNKLVANKTRDQRANRALRREGWRVIRIWEHDVKGRIACCVRRVQKALRASR